MPTKKVTKKVPKAVPKKVAKKVEKKVTKKAGKSVTASTGTSSAKAASQSSRVTQKTAAKVAPGTESTVKAGPQPGDVAPPFELVNQAGVVTSSSQLKGAAYVLYFYPKDSTPGCTLEACDFRDHHASFAKKKVQVFGVSGDSEKSHAGFAAKHSLPFSLLVDEGNVLASAYGAFGPKKLYGREFLGIIRSTFVVGRDGRIIAAFRGVKVPGHVEKILEQVL